ncbi:MAG TPA: helix-turn-helix domain-containing protein [Solirubrobacteraceae bacterium]|jgi:DNA-binding HxlR family transcriptional regulator|nr:helix-turn-helix domain-containing protein [Solirubrobacteraceae bacterium]
MLGSNYTDQNCSIAGALEIVGERWSLLIVRNVFLGLRRFDQIQANLGIARNVLQTRLQKLIDQGVVERRLYQERPPRHEYRLTEKGLDLWPIVVSLMQWGDRYAMPEGGPAVLLEHRGCGGRIDEHRICDRCGARLGPRDSRAQPGPGAISTHPLLTRAERSAGQQPAGASEHPAAARPPAAA